MQNLANNKRINRLIIIFSFTVLIYQVLYLIIPFRQVLEYCRLGFVSPLLAVIGLGIFLWDVIFDRICLKDKNCYLLIALIGILCISSLFVIDYGLSANAKNIVWQIVQMLVIFPLYNRLPGDKWIESAKKLYIIVLIFFIPANIISIIQYFTITGYYVKLSTGTVRQGFMGGRLFGVFSSPHYAGLFMLVLVIVSIAFAVKTKSVWKRVAYITVAVICYIYSALTGTRSIILGTAATVFVVALAFLYKYFARKHNTKSVLKHAVCILASIFIMLVSAATPMVISMASGKSLAFIYNNCFDGDTVNPDNPADGDIVFERDDINTANISNHRFKIWSEYLNVTTDSIRSFLLGNSPGSYTEYVRQNYPDLFIVEYIKTYYPEMFKHNYIYDTHNAYLGAFVSSGAIGLAVLLAFLLFIFYKAVKHIYKCKKVSVWTYALMAIWILILVSSFFDSDLFFKCNSTSVVFWFISGLLVKSVQENIC